MTVGIKDTVANGWLDGIAGFYAQLHTAEPGTAGTTSPTTGTVSGARQQVTMAAASGGSKARSSGGSWTGWDGGSVTITHISDWSTAGSGAGVGTAATGGVYQFDKDLSASKAITNGDTFNLTTYTVTITPIIA